MPCGETAVSTTPTNRDPPSRSFTAAAGLEAGGAPGKYTFSCPGFIIVDDRRIRCHKIAGHGSTDFCTVHGEQL